jgi:Mrp family chromosome partitioning ATPase
VVRWGKTHRSQVAAAANSLQAVNSRILGTVLTMRKASRAERRRYAIDTYYVESRGGGWSS